MTRKLTCLIAFAALLGVGSSVRGESFSVMASDDGHVCNDSQYGPDVAYNTETVHARNTNDPRRRVGYIKFDISEIKGLGRVFSNVSLSLYGYGAGEVDIYGLIEELDHTVENFQALTWDTAPGVQNDPTPELSSPVQLDMDELVGPLFSFRTPGRDVRESSEPSQALADFMNADTDGIIVLVVSAHEGQSSLFREVDWHDGEGAELLEGEVAGLPRLAADPDPDHLAEDVCRDVVLSWEPGAYAHSHDVYFGTSLDAVTNATVAVPLGVLASPGQDANAYDPDGLLEFGQTYYWRVDEVNSAPDFTVSNGSVWSFTTEPFIYLLENVTAIASTTSAADRGPEKMIDGSGLANGQHSIDQADMWLGDAVAGEPVWVRYDFDRTYKMYEMHIWNYNSEYEAFLGFGLKDVTIEYATDVNDWMVLGDFELAQAPGTADYAGWTVNLGGIPAKSIRFVIHRNWGPRVGYGLSEVQFYYIPAHAREPQPASGAADVDPEVTLAWRAGREAVSHQVYLSTDSNAVADGTAPVDTAESDSFYPGSLSLGQTYYWRVDEVNEAATPSIWQSDVWSFSTKEYFIIDDFESYTDDEANRIYKTWADGYYDDTNGSQVGHNSEPYAELTIVHNGAQAMPFYYENIGGVVNSEAERTFSVAQDWTVNGADTLSLWFRGDPIGFLAISDSEIVMNGIGTDIYSTADEGRVVYKQLSGDGTIVARVDSLDETDPWAKAGVMIRQTLQADSVWAYSVWTPGHGFRFQNRAAVGGSGASDSSVATAEQIAVTAPVWVKLERAGNQFSAYYATDDAPTTWVPSPINPVTITMTDPVYIGLAVTSHNTAETTQAVFSGIATTSNVIGQWQSVSLTVDQPAGNGADTFYVAVEDSLGKKKAINNPSVAAVGMGSWQEWKIPLSDFGGADVNLKSIKKLYLGVGDKTQPSQNAAGVLYIDDVAFGHPAPVEE
ncbi:MAG: hypothetical protein JW955_16830 [Sedimentisphaerales bacterium]|nr:hypothetical protein [Sedimentisphaerales bacterium]